MDTERLAEEYVKRKSMLDTLGKTVNELKEMLSKAVDEQGDVDDKGHRWLTAGRFMLKREKRQPEPQLDKEEAEQWAKSLGVWDKVKVVREELDEDALAGFAFEMRDDPEVIDAYRKLFKKKDPTWAFIAPKEQQSYDY